MNPLTERQQQIYDYLVKCIGAGKPPTVREIGAEFGIRSPNGVMCHLKALEKKGLITRSVNKSCGISLVAPSIEKLMDMINLCRDVELCIDDNLSSAPAVVLLWLEDVLKHEVESE